jgi:hypothetical protein
VETEDEHSGPTEPRSAELSVLLITTIEMLEGHLHCCLEAAVV